MIMSKWLVGAYLLARVSVNPLQRVSALFWEKQIVKDNSLIINKIFLAVRDIMLIVESFINLIVEC